MPEGDTIHRTAATLRPWFVGKKILATDGWADWIDFPSLAGRTVTAIEARGKHLLLHLDDHRVVHGHCGMTGSWHIYPHGQAWLKPARRAALVLQTDELSVVFFNPKTLELLTPSGLRRHRFLSRLGPDLLGDQLDVDEVIERFRTRNHRPIGEVVMDQTACCGIGNIYKSELLFLQNIDPFAPVAILDDLALRDLIDLARDLMQHNLQGSNRTTRFAGDGGKLWVYGRRGEPCYLCGMAIQLRRQGDLGRTTYWCSECQPPAAGSTQPIAEQHDQA
ncbi:Fpg/Nei family DNA glycosylase [Aeoliella sp.]|uniref:Fpg/Nei family DNA glycosylase n=1 Tax=Aeoliella sp. TaxID=2795800 RepID=UPI003CCC4299